MHLLCCSSGCGRCNGESREYGVLVKIVNMRGQVGRVEAEPLCSVGKAVDSICDPRVNVCLTH